jgi:hypothetical protein
MLSQHYVQPPTQLGFWNFGPSEPKTSSEIARETAEAFSNDTEWTMISVVAPALALGLLGALVGGRKAAIAGVVIGAAGGIGFTAILVS